MTRLALILALAALALPAAALADGAPTPAQQASTFCKAQRTSLGTAVFTQTYGGGANAYGKCVSKLQAQADQNASSAAKACKAEQADASFASTHDNKTFDQFYAGNSNNAKNAYGKCVSTKAQQQGQAQQQATIAAAKACKADRATDKVAFAGTYGSRANAFGKCVSTKAKASA